MFGACSVLLRMNKSAQVGGAQTHHDKIGGRNDVDDILFAYGVVTRRLPSSCIHTEHGVYYRGIDTIQTTSSVQTAASRSSERQKPIYSVHQDEREENMYDCIMIDRVEG